MRVKSKRFIKYFLLISLPILLFWTISLIYNIQGDRKNFKDKVISENVIKNEKTSFLVLSYISNLIHSTRIFSNSNLIQTYFDDTTSMNEQSLSDKFKQIVQTDVEIYKIVFIDYLENKIISSEYVDDDNISSNTTQIDDDSLIDNNIVSNIIISSLSFFENPLSTEDNAKIEFSAPLFDSNNKLRGKLLIIYNANNLIKILTKYSSVDDKIAKVLILKINEFGNYDITNSSCDNSFCPSVDCDLLNLDLLEKSKYSDSGYIIVDNYLYTYFNVLSKVDSVNIYKNEKWIVVNEFCLKPHFSFISFIKNDIYGFYSIFFLIIILFSLIISYFINKILINKEEISLARMVAETTNDSVIILNHKLRITFVNKAFETLLGFKAKNIIGKSIRTINVTDNNPLLNNDILKSIIEKRKWSTQIWQQKKNGLYFPINLNIFATDHKNVEQQYIGLINDLTINSSCNINDDNFLTYNGKIIYDSLSKKIDINHRYVLIYLHIDNHREIGEIFAKENIDLIDFLVSIIKPHIGEFDVFAKTGQYVINILSIIDDIYISPSSYVKNLHEKISKSVKVGDSDIFIKTTIGSSLYPNDTTDFRQLFANSAIACEWNSVIGKVDFSMFTSKMNEDLKRNNLIVKNLHYALEHNEFYMNYQPQIDINTGKVAGLEALIRWDNYELGKISPSEFIPIAENNHIMGDLGKWIIKTVLSDFKYIFSHLFEIDASFRCAINVSAIQLEEEDFLFHLYNSIDENSLNYENIEIEITENSFLDQLKRTKPILENINSKGISIAIDDFGTGYSSLSYLSRIPIDKIKIDRGFIMNYPNSDNGELVKFLVKMSRILNKKVLVEGVEIEEQANYLKNIGCQFIQGYFYSKPLSIEDTIKYINTPTLRK